MNTASTNQESAAMTTAELAQAVREMQRRNDPATTSAAWAGVLRAIKTNPRPFAFALGILAADLRNGQRVH